MSPYRRLVYLAMVGSAILHGPLLLLGTYRGTYDAYVHIFFADHYRRSWWSLWEPRWYTGFTMVSYPPLTHQLTALLSFITGTLPLGFIVVMLTAAILTTLGVYRFSRLWVDERPAAYAALLLVLSSSISETVHVFGQLPTMFVMGVLLNALPFVWAYIEKGKASDLAKGWALLMVAAAGHHVTTLFGMVFFSGPVFATVLVQKFRTARLDEPSQASIKEGEALQGRNVSIKILRQKAFRRLKRVMPTLIRCGVFGVGLVFILVITVLPYWLWSKSDPITQITIPHSSRDSFFQNQPAGLMFFLIPWGVLLVALPYALYKGFGSRNWILAGSLVAVFVFGTGGTTPLPAMILRGAFYILTLDRFTFWGSIMILPFVGQMVESMIHGNLRRWMVAHFGNLFATGVPIVLGLAMLLMVYFTATLTQYRKFQPEPIDMTPIVEFLAKDNHDRWRYLTLGFGDQMAWLSAQTTALNVEGNYHSARRLPEMTSTPVERLDGAKYTAIPGLGSLQQFLTNPQKYELKYVFVKDAFYEPLLFFAGWNRLGRLDNDVIVWERADVPPLPAEIPQTVYPAWQRLMWGTLPVGSIFVVATVFLSTEVIFPLIRRWRTRRRERRQLAASAVTDEATTAPPPADRPLRRWWGWIQRFKWVRGWIIDEPDQLPNRPSEEWMLWKLI